MFYYCCFTDTVGITVWNSKLPLHMCSPPLWAHKTHKDRTWTYFLHLIQFIANILCVLNFEWMRLLCWYFTAAPQKVISLVFCISFLFYLFRFSIKFWVFVDFFVIFSAIQVIYQGQEQVLNEYFNTNTEMFVWHPSLNNHNTKAASCWLPWKIWQQLKTFPTCLPVVSALSIQKYS